jgi:hypothetical protein
MPLSSVNHPKFCELSIMMVHQMAAAALAAQDARPPHRRRLRGVARQLAPDGAAAS